MSNKTGMSGVATALVEFQFDLAEYRPRDIMNLLSEHLSGTALGDIYMNFPLTRSCSQDALESNETHSNELIRRSSIESSMHLAKSLRELAEESEMLLEQIKQIEV